MIKGNETVAINLGFPTMVGQSPDAEVY